jgi:hypothetical protein
VGAGRFKGQNINAAKQGTPEMFQQATETDEYNRKRQALYLTGLLPDDPREAQEVLTLCERLVAALADPDPPSATE